jgi:hypothetical protein
MLSAFKVELDCKAESAFVPWAAVAYAEIAVVATSPKPNVVLAAPALASSISVAP